MASRHHSLDLSEIADVTDLVVGFQAHNNVRLSLRFGVVVEKKVPGIVIVAEAWEDLDDQPAAKPLASLTVKCSALNLKTWNAALTHVLYAMDFQLALAEWERAEQKSG